jgi:hypothetical protein
MSSPAIDALLVHWRSHKVELNPGAAESELAELEQVVGTRLPTEMRAFYARVNGMVRDTSDELLFSLWPLEVLKAARTEERVPLPHNAAVLAFGDFLIDSHFYAVQLDGDDVGSVAVVWPNGTLERLADSFESFLVRYWREPESLYMFYRPLTSGA